MRERKRVSLEEATAYLKKLDYLKPRDFFFDDVALAEIGREYLVNGNRTFKVKGRPFAVTHEEPDRIFVTATDRVAPCGWLLRHRLEGKLNDAAAS